MNKEVFESQAQRIWLGEDGILYIVAVPNAEISLADAREMTDASVRLAGGKKRPLFADLQQIKSITREAREHYASGAPQAVQAVALYVDLKISTILGNIFMAYNKPRVPTKMFTDRNEAIQWLKGFLKEA